MGRDERQKNVLCQQMYVYKTHKYKICVVMEQTIVG